MAVIQNSSADFGGIQKFHLLFKWILIFLLISIILSCSSSTRFSKSGSKQKSNISSKTEADNSTHRSRNTQGALWQTATTWLGAPYRYGGTDRSGIDCSALAGHIYRDVYGIDLPRTVALMMKDGKSVNENSLKEGDLLFFKNTRTGPVDHVGIYLGEGRFLHASTSSGVIISDNESGLYRRRLIKVRRYVR